MAPLTPYSGIFYLQVLIPQYFTEREGYLAAVNQMKSKIYRLGYQKKCGGVSSRRAATVLPLSSNKLTSGRLNPRLEVALFKGQSHQWGRHGFDGDACGQEACRGAHTRNRVQNDNCQSTDGIRSLINLSCRPPRLCPWAAVRTSHSGLLFSATSGWGS